jgi:hypothetical protein
VQDGADTRLLREGELVLLSLPLDSVKCAGWGSRKPIPGNFVLTADEVGNVKKAITQFNTTIATINKAKNIPVVDMYAYFKTIQSGVAYNGINYNASFVSGALFSLDGVHPSARGYALIANHILNVINNYYAARISMVDPNKFPGVQYP